MKLNHANLCTSDVAALSGIFVRHFAFEVEHVGSDFAMLRGDDGFSLVLMKAGDGPATYPASFMAGIGFHIGFVVEMPADVHAKHDELRAAGFQVGPIKSFEAIGSTWTAFYCPVGDGIDIEVTART